MIVKGFRISIYGDENILKLWLHISVNTLKTIELYTLNEKLCGMCLLSQ